MSGSCHRHVGNKFCGLDHVHQLGVRRNAVTGLAWATRSVSTAAAARYRQASEATASSSVRVVPECCDMGSDFLGHYRVVNRRQR